MSALPGTTGRRRIYLMRHGHVDYFSEETIRAGNISQTPLTSLGQDQAAAAGHALAHVSFDRIICSGLPRTLQTAEIVKSKQESASPEIESLPALKEVESGKATGIESREAFAALMTFHFDSASDEGGSMLEGGERFVDASTRATKQIKNLLSEPGWHTILIAAHEGINRLILGWMTGDGSGPGIGAMGAFEQDTACINILDFDMVPKEGSQPGTKIERKMIKAVNITPYNFTKHGMNLTSLESIVAEY